MRITRRALLAGSGATGLVLVTGQAWRASAPSDVSAALRAAVTTVVPEATVAAPTRVADLGTLHVPRLLSPTLQGGMRMFALTLQRGQQAFAGRTVETLGINGPYLGPTLRAAEGDMVMFTVVNRIGEPTTLHWHGMHLPAMMDGGPHQLIGDGATWHSDFTIRQQAATLWYHPHLMGQTRTRVTRGAVGMIIFDDTNPVHAALPHDYGVDDLP